MNILVTGAEGFIGKNLAAALKNIRDGKDRTHPNIKIDEIYEYDLGTGDDELRDFCSKADFVFHFAGVNRPQKAEEYMAGNRDFTEKLLSMLKNGSCCPVVLSSSTQAELDNDYGKSKLAAEKSVLKYGQEAETPVLIYRFPNVFGKWCRPNYNSAVATFCYNMANNLPIKVNNKKTMLTLLYIDDLVSEMLAALEGLEHREHDGGAFCTVPGAQRATLGEITGLLERFAMVQSTILMPEICEGSFESKLFATYISYLPEEKMLRVLKMNTDDRGSFTEIMKSENCGQFSVNVSKPGITKGRHWHNTKWEIFIVVSGKGLIRERKIGTDGVLEFEVDGEHQQAVLMLPGYTHEIINLSTSQNLVTIIWANEKFDPQKPDTYFEEV